MRRKKKLNTYLDDGQDEHDDNLLLEGLVYRHPLLAQV